MHNMPKFARHLKAIEDSKKLMNINKLETIKKQTNDNIFKMLANTYAKSLGLIAPNNLSNQK